MKSVKISLSELNELIKREPSTIEKYKAIILDNTRKCENCGKEFLLYTNHTAIYCKDCSRDGAKIKYRNKVENDPVLSLFDTAYGTRYARIRYGKWTKEDLDIWQKEARDKIKAVNNGEIDFKEYYIWMKK